MVKVLPTTVPTTPATASSSQSPTRDPTSDTRVVTSSRTSLGTCSSNQSLTPCRRPSASSRIVGASSISCCTSSAIVGTRRKPTPTSTPATATYRVRIAVIRASRGRADRQGSSRSMRPTPGPKMTASKKASRKGMMALKAVKRTQTRRPKSASTIAQRR